MCVLCVFYVCLYVFTCVICIICVSLYILNIFICVGGVWVGGVSVRKRGIKKGKLPLFHVVRNLSDLSSWLGRG